MSLTGSPLFLIGAVAVVAGPIAAVIFWPGRRRTTGWLAVVGRLAMVVFCQLLAVGVAFLWANNQYGFYSSWLDLAGRSGAPETIHTNGVSFRGSGTLQTVTVAGGPGTNGSHQVLVWLPPQYQASTAQNIRFPVVMVLPGQPSTPEAMFSHFEFGKVATAAITSGRVPPFVAVFPPLMTNPPRDTECTDIAGGPQAESWLSRDVYRSIQQTLRVDSGPWSVIGYSTGGFCAAKLLLHYPNQYQAAAGMGGYYETLTDHTTGDLFQGSNQARDHNSPTWLYRHGGLHQRPILIVTGRQDKGYSSTARFLTTTAHDPEVSSLIFPTGSHNYHNYRDQLPAILGWLKDRGAFAADRPGVTHR